MKTETKIEHQIMLQRENKDSPVILTGAVRYLEDGKHS